MHKRPITPIPQDAPASRRRLGDTTDDANRKRHLICDGRGVPLAIQLTGANRNDSQQALFLVYAIPLLHGERGRPRRRPDRVLGDHGYDAEAIRQGLRARRIVPLLANGRLSFVYTDTWRADPNA